MTTLKLTIKQGRGVVCSIQSFVGRLTPEQYEEVLGMERALNTYLPEFRFHIDEVTKLDEVRDA